MPHAEWRKGRNMEKHRSVVAFFLMCGAGALLAAAGDTLTRPTPVSRRISTSADIPFQSLKQAPTWRELERMLDNPHAIAACPPDGIGQPAR